MSVYGNRASAGSLGRLGMGGEGSPSCLLECTGWKGRSHVLHWVPNSSEKSSVPAAQAGLPLRVPALLQFGRLPLGAPGTHRAEDCHFTMPGSVCVLCAKRWGTVRG